ncbi:MAG: molybdate ABC transporter substrate-binding protein [Streptosporangiaceae bacterium]
MSGRDAGAEAGLVEFSAAPFDMVEDLCGDPGADLVVFFAGNQYMVVPDVVSGFLAAHPSVGSVFYETLPPGVVAAHLRAGALRMGSLVLRVRPDVMASSPAALGELEHDGLVGPARSYASNDLALLVAAGNPAGVSGWADLGRSEVRVAFPDPRTEGIGRLALEALEASGGAALRHRVEVDKAESGDVVFTSIHHRQGPAWLAAGATDVAVVWSTEARYHLGRGGPFEKIALPQAENRRGAYAAAVVTSAAHREAAGWFVEYLCGEAGQAAYAAHGFSVPGSWGRLPAGL